MKDALDAVTIQPLRPTSGQEAKTEKAMSRMDAMDMLEQWGPASGADRQLSRLTMMMTVMPCATCRGALLLL
jgi:tRNA(Arg) A34 adenosine deaminase TadA